jgi:hypothetical protein
MSITAGLTAISPAELQRLQEAPDEVGPFLYPDNDDEPPNTIDLDKAWHGLHYLLTGEAEEAPPPFGDAILGGIEIGQELVYGPARFLTPEQVAAVHAALTGLTPEALAQRFDPQNMEIQDIYPDIWMRDGDEALDYVLAFLPTLQTFYRDATARGDAALLWMA